MFLDEPLSLFVAAGIGVFNETIFQTSMAHIPETGDGPFLTLVGTGGTPVPTHNSRLQPAYVDTNLQLFARGTDPVAVFDMLLACLAVLYPIANQLVAGVWWLSVTPLQVVPMDLGVDDNERINMSLNFVIRRRPNAAMSS